MADDHAVGALGVFATVALLSVVISVETVVPPRYHVVPAANTAEVVRQVAAAPRITSLPPKEKRRGRAPVASSSSTAP